METHLNLNQPVLESIGVMFVLLFFTGLFIIVKEELYYQKIRIKSDESEKDKQIFLEAIIQNWWCRNRFLKDLKKGRIPTNLTAEKYEYITVPYRTVKSPENLKKAVYQLSALI